MICQASTYATGFAEMAWNACHSQVCWITVVCVCVTIHEIAMTSSSSSILVIKRVLVAGRCSQDVSQAGAQICRKRPFRLLMCLLHYGIFHQQKVALVSRDLAPHIYQVAHRIHLQCIANEAHTPQVKGQLASLAGEVVADCKYEQDNTATTRRAACLISLELCPVLER